MGSNELMITEMVLQCILADQQPSEIAALLSCLVFQHRTRGEPKLTGMPVTLQKVIHTTIFT
jgi:antiviral helicase SKI2